MTCTTCGKKNPIAELLYRVRLAYLIWKLRRRRDGKNQKG